MVTLTGDRTLHMLLAWPKYSGAGTYACHGEQAALHLMHGGTKGREAEDHGVLARRIQVEEVLIHGRRCVRVDKGNSMRLTLVDISGVPEAKLGDLVILDGRDGQQEPRRPLNFAAVSMNVPRVPKW